MPVYFRDVILGISTLAVGACASEINNDDLIPANKMELSQSAVLAIACTGCHGNSSQTIPNFEPFTADALERTLKAYKVDEGNTVMHRLMRGYTDEEIERIAHHLGSDDE